MINFGKSQYLCRQKKLTASWMPVSEDIRLKSLTASSIQTDEQELDRYHRKTLSANTYRGRDGEIARFTAFLEVREGDSAKYLKPGGNPIPLATFKAFMRVRAMMIEKPRFPNGRTSTRAMKGRLWTLVAALSDITGVPISSADRHQVEAYIDTDLKRELSLNTGTFAKPITSFADFMRLLNACWSAAVQFHSPREAKQPAFLPWRSDPDISEGIIWGDITGALFVPDGIDEVRIKYMIKWRSLKGKRNTDADSKDGYHEQEEVHLAGLDATLFITAFGLEDQVFEHFSRYEQIGSITAATVRDAGGEIPLVIKESARQTRLLQDIRYDPTIQKWRTYPEQAIRYSTMREKWKALLRLYFATMTSLRRMYQNACEAAGVSEADRKHGSGHNPSSRAYLQSYKSGVIAVDTRRVLLGLPTQRDNRMRAMGLTRYGTSAAELPSHRLRNAEVPEHITKMREKLDELLKRLSCLRRPRRKNTKAFNKFKQDLRSSFVKEQSIERARLAFRPSSACDPISTISASLLNKDSGRAKPPPFNPDFPLDPALFEEEDQDQGESMAGQSTGEADNVDQEFEDELEPTAVLRHQPDHQRLIDALTAHCATSVLPAAEHFFVKHVNGPAVSIKCAVQLEDGVCDAPYPNSEKGRVRHLEIYHGIIALSMTWGGKKDDPPIPTLDSRIACCSECKIWIKGYAAMHMHADSHLQADLPQMHAHLNCSRRRFRQWIVDSAE
ncbi:hypothetical protein IAS59_005489 [Cryptococcus gattii]